MRAQLARCERLGATVGGDQFERADKPDAARLADQRVTCEPLKPGLKLRAAFGGIRDQIALFDDADIFQRDGRADRVPSGGIAMPQNSDARASEFWGMAIPPEGTRSARPSRWKISASSKSAIWSRMPPNAARSFRPGLRGSQVTRWSARRAASGLSARSNWSPPTVAPRRSHRASWART